MNAASYPQEPGGLPGRALDVHNARQRFEGRSILAADSLPLAYTSFDGDFINHVHRMCMGALLLQYAPLNPEAALGYYISTTSLGNVKPEVMKACLAVEFKADELWILTPGGEDALSTLPEGVIAEYLLWKEFRPDAPVRTFPWLNDMEWGEFLRASSPREAVLATALLDDRSDATIRSLIDDEFGRNLEARLLGPVRESGLPPVVFVGSDEKFDKHLDWARQAIYRSGSVPFAPASLATRFVLDVAKLDRRMRRAVRNAYLARSDQLWFFVEPSGSPELGEDLQQDLAEWLELDSRTDARIVGWDQVGVPKYTNMDWALTNRERREVRDDPDTVPGSMP